MMAFIFRIIPFLSGLSLVRLAEKSKSEKKRIVDGLFVSNSIQDLSIIGSTLNEIHFGPALPTKEKNTLENCFLNFFVRLIFFLT